MRIGIAAEQYETTFPDTSSQIFGLNGNHRAAIGKIDVPKNADLPIGDGASGCVDDRWPQPGRPDLHAIVAGTRPLRVIVLAGQLGHPILGDDLFLIEAEAACQLRVELVARDLARSPFESAGLHDSRSRTRRKNPAVEVVEERRERKCRARDANRNVFFERERKRVLERRDVETFARSVDERSTFTIAALLRDMPHHVSERRALAIRDEQQIAQRQLLSSSEHEVIESREQCRVVQCERAVLEIMLAGVGRRRPARFEDGLCFIWIERRERCVFERRRRDRGYLVPMFRKPEFVESKTARECSIGCVIANLVREDIAREVVELVLG
jgi:hypothetical protein